MGKQSDYRREAKRQNKQVDFLTQGAAEMKAKQPMKKMPMKPGKPGKKPC